MRIKRSRKRGNKIKLPEKNYIVTSTEEIVFNNHFSNIGQRVTEFQVTMMSASKILLLNKNLVMVFLFGQ